MKLSTFNKVNAAILTQYLVFKDGKPSDIFTVDYGKVLEGEDNIDKLQELIAQKADVTSVSNWSPNSQKICVTVKLN